MIHLLFILACWRLTNLLYAEGGPVNVFDHARAWLDRVPTLAEGRRCPLCVSIWMAALLAPVYVLATGTLTPMLIVYVLAWSAGSCLIYILLDIFRSNYKWNQEAFKK